MIVKTQEQLQAERRAFDNGYWAGVGSAISALVVAAWLAIICLMP